MSQGEEQERSQTGQSEDQMQLATRPKEEKVEDEKEQTAGSEQTQKERQRAIVVEDEIFKADEGGNPPVQSKLAIIVEEVHTLTEELSSWRVWAHAKSDENSHWLEAMRQQFLHLVMPTNATADDSEERRICPGGDQEVEDDSMEASPSLPPPAGTRHILSDVDEGRFDDDEHRADSGVIEVDFREAGLAETSNLPEEQGNSPPAVQTVQEGESSKEEGQVPPCIAYPERPPSREGPRSNVPPSPAKTDSSRRSTPHQPKNYLVVDAFGKHTALSPTMPVPKDLSFFSEVENILGVPYKLPLKQHREEVQQKKNKEYLGGSVEEEGENEQVKARLLLFGSQQPLQPNSTHAWTLPSVISNKSLELQTFAKEKGMRKKDSTLISPWTPINTESISRQRLGPDFESGCSIPHGTLTQTGESLHVQSARNWSSPKKEKTDATTVETARGGAKEAPHFTYPTPPQTAPSGDIRRIMNVHGVNKRGDGKGNSGDGKGNSGQQPTTSAEEEQEKEDGTENNQSVTAHAETFAAGLSSPLAKPSHPYNQHPLKVSHYGRKLAPRPVAFGSRGGQRQAHSPPPSMTVVPKPGLSSKEAAASLTVRSKLMTTRASLAVSNPK